MAQSENKVMAVINAVGEAILMNLAFLVCCIPVITIGQAWCGLYTAIGYRTRGEKWQTGFKKGFCSHFLRGTIAWMILLLPIGYMAFRTYAVWFYRTENPNFIVELIINGIGLLMAIGLQTNLVLANVYLPGDTMQWLENGIKMTFTAPLHTLCPLTVTWLPVVLGLFFPNLLFLTLLVFVAVFFALGALVTTVVYLPKLKKLSAQIQTNQEDSV